MRWKTKAKTPRPNEGDKRTLEQFAWFPAELDDGHTVWLESFYVEQIWQHGPMVIRIGERLHRTEGSKWRHVKSSVITYGYG